MLEEVAGSGSATFLFVVGRFGWCLAFLWLPGEAAVCAGVLVLTLFDAVATCQKRNMLCDTRVRFADAALGIMVGVVVASGRDG